MTHAALISRSCNVQHPRHTHALSSSLSSVCLPHSLHSLDEASNVGNCNTFLPRHSDLYLMKFKNIPHPASLIDNARQWFLSIPETFRLSKHEVSDSLVIVSDSLCKKSLRWLAIFSCCLATLCDHILYLLLSFWQRLNCFCIHFRCTSALRRYLGLSVFFPSEQIIKLESPKSKALDVFSSTGFFSGIGKLFSQSTLAKYFPVAVLLIVTVFISPLYSLCSSIEIPVLNLGSHNLFFSIITFCGQANDWFSSRFDLYLGLPILLSLYIFIGKPFFFLSLIYLSFFFLIVPSFSSLKKRVYAASRCSIDSCCDWLFTSRNHSNSSFKSTSCFFKSYLDNEIPCEAYAYSFTSRARLYIKRTAPKCWASNSSCSESGYIRYLKAFNMLTNIRNNYEEKMKILVSRYKYNTIFVI